MDAVEIVGEKLAPFNPSHDDVVHMALELMNLQENDILYDLGCGDARVLLKVKYYLYRLSKSEL
jgi:hypothetical protein